MQCFERKTDDGRYVFFDTVLGREITFSAEQLEPSTAAHLDAIDEAHKAQAEFAHRHPQYYT